MLWRMDANLTISVLGVLIAVIGVAMAILAGWEFTQLRALRKEFDAFRAEWSKELWRREKASHRIIASYSVADPAQRAELILTALKAHPEAFNGWNALGYAYMEMGETHLAIDAFHDAIAHHPDALEGYMDLAAAYVAADQPDLCIKHLRAAIKIDPSAKSDIDADPRFTGCAYRPANQTVRGVIHGDRPAKRER